MLQHSFRERFSGSDKLTYRNVVAILMVLFMSLLAGCAGMPDASSSYSGKGLPSPGEGSDDIVLLALALMDAPYRWGGEIPVNGFDCSGFIRYVFANASVQIKLPRTVEEMSTQGRGISIDNIAPGDLVFFNTQGRVYSHAGIYIGDKKFIHAPSTGGQVRVASMLNAYWSKRFTGARRVLKDAKS